MAETIELSPWLWFSLGACALLTTLWARWRHTGTWVVSLWAFCLISAYSASTNQHTPKMPQSCGGEEGLWRGRILGPIERQPGGEPLGDRSYEAVSRQRVFLTLSAERCDDSWQARQGRVRVLLGAGPTVFPGDSIVLRLRLEPFVASFNPVGFDPQAYAERYRLSARATVMSEHALINSGAGVLHALGRARQRAAKYLDALLPTGSASLAKALGLGDRSGIDVDRRDRWSKAGLSHLLAISGLHVGFVTAWVYLLLCHFLGFVPKLTERYSARRVAAALTLPVIGTFCLWSGASPSAVRASVMAGAFLLSFVLRRPADGLNALGIAGSGMLLADPASLYDTGFLLSFVAVAALLLFLPRHDRITSIPARVFFWLRSMVVVSLIATLATAPVLAGRFGQVSLIGIIANVVAVPVTTVVAMPTALLAGLIGPFVPGLDGVFHVTLSAVLGFLDTLAEVAASLPGASIELPSPSILEISVYFTMLILVVLSFRGRPVRLYAMLDGGPFSLGWMARRGAFRGWAIAHLSSLRGTGRRGGGCFSCRRCHALRRGRRRLSPRHRSWAGNCHAVFAVAGHSYD
ncbi:MAG: ComEC/Rec2 family competence protein [Myxococcota bacterium]